jgi:hypothetical protein
VSLALAARADGRRGGRGTRAARGIAPIASSNKPASNQEGNKRKIQMKKEELLRKVAPCGLLCYTCAAAKHGAIRIHSQALLELLDSFDRFAEQFSAHEPRLSKYADFKQVLLSFSEASCEGCRDGICMYPGCPVSPCIKEKGYDFCFECEAFPCEEADFDPALRAKWAKANKRMREVGVEAYFNEVENKSHYA